MSQSFAVRPGASSTAVVPQGGSGPSKNWSARFPVYQIDFTAVASGKRIATTKRRIRWRFGFPNREALENGETGTACRGEEHDVTIVWSVTSGKRLILADGQEVHYSTNRAGVLEFSWTMRGNHVLKVLAHAAPQVNSTPGFRQYDLHVDGQSFFNMPKVYELGIKGPIPSHARVPGVISRGTAPSGRAYDSRKNEYAAVAPRTKHQEEEDLQRAIQASIEESRAHLSKSKGEEGKSDSKPAAAPAAAAVPPPTPDTPVNTAAPPQIPAPAPVAGGDLLDFSFDAPAPTAPAPVALPSSAVPAVAPAGYNAFAAPPPPTPSTSAGPESFAMVPAPAAPGLYGGVEPASQLAAPDPAAVQQYGAPTPASAGQFNAPPPPPVQQFSVRAPPDQQFSSPDTAQFSAQAPSAVQQPDVFGAPGQAPAVQDPFSPQPIQQTFTDISNEILNAYSNEEQPVATQPDAVPVTTAHTNSAPPVQLKVDTAPIESEAAQEESSEVDVAMKKLINFDDISSPAESEKPLTMNPFAEDPDLKNGKPKTSRGIPPPAAGWAGPQPTLQEMKTIKPPEERRSIMNTPAHVYDAAAAPSGSLVVHGSQNGNFGGYGQGPPPLNQQTGYGAGGGFGAMSAPVAQQGYGAPPQAYAAQPQPYGVAPQYQQQPQQAYPPQYQQQPQQAYPPQPTHQPYNNY